VKVLLIDDESSLLKLIQMSLQNPTTTITTAETAKRGLELFLQETYDVAVCDIGLPDLDGLEVLKKMKASLPEIPVVMITAHGSISSALQAMRTGAYDYIQKPFEPEELKIVLERALNEKKMSTDLQRLRQEVKSQYDFSNIIGNSPAIKAVFERIRKAADTKSTILILGESGTGKELLAKAIHFNSSRRDGPFVVIDCGAIPENLLESELFGHLKGAFTGADRTKKGLFEEAHGGSVFLDEIGEMPTELQSKLLRVLQESTIRRVGDAKPIEIDVRIIAATNRNLELEVKEGKFRQDLYYRLNVIPLNSPSLRERREDIPLLANFFLKKYSKEYKRDLKAISPQVMDRFRSFDWPGNVRQLENLIEQMVVMAEGENLTVENLPPPLNEGTPVEPATVPTDSWDLKAAIEKVTSYTEECMIRKALQQTNKNKTKAAELLKISRRALIYKVQEYKIEQISETEIQAVENDPA